MKMQRGHHLGNFSKRVGTALTKSFWREKRQPVTRQLWAGATPAFFVASRVAIDRAPGLQREQSKYEDRRGPGCNLNI